MSDASDLSETIKEAAQGPRKAEGDEGKFESHSLKELIEADRHLTGKKVAKNPLKSIRFAKISRPGGA